MLRSHLAAAVSSIALLAAPGVLAQPQGDVGQYSDVTVQGSVLEPEPIAVSDDEELAALIRVPEGFSVAVAGRDMGNIRMLATHGEHVYATRRTEADVVRLNDADGDGVYEDFTVVAARPGMHGITIHGETAYLATVNDVYTAPIAADGTFGDLTRIIDDLPDGGQHPNRTLAIGPDGMLYLSTGSTCNACAETNPESATLLRARPDGSSRMIFATGLRNTIGFGWHPETGRLYGADHGIDWLGDNEQQEEFNLVEQGKQYGWPYIYDFSRLNPQDNPPEGITLEQWAERSEEPELGYTSHSAPMQMTFYTGNAFPEEYRGDAFIAMRGSWNRRPPSGYEISRVDFNAENEPVTWDHFAEGFLIEGEDGGYGFLSRLAGITQTAEGDLLVADDFNGILFRISAAGEATAQAGDAVTPPDLTEKPAPSDIAIKLVEAEAELSVTARFADGELIPLAHAAEGDNASPALEWGEAPEGTQSFVVIVDDPDAAEPKPFVHWVLFDVPGDARGVREGLPSDPVLQDPAGAKQGVNSRGQIGYMGPRPPLGDPAHNYHFQVFALDIAELGIAPGSPREEVIAAMDGHVLAEGQIVGQYGRPGDEAPVN